jgi:hypothetical protein
MASAAFCTALCIPFEAELAPRLYSPRTGELVDCFALAVLPRRMLIACQQLSSNPLHWSMQSTLLHG